MCCWPFTDLEIEPPPRRYYYTTTHAPRLEDQATSYTYVPRSSGPAYHQPIHYQPPQAGIPMNYYPQQYIPPQAPIPDGSFYPTAPPPVLNPAVSGFLPMGTGMVYNPLATPFHPTQSAPVLHPPTLAQQAPQALYYGRTEAEIADDEARGWFNTAGERTNEIAPADPRLDDMFYVIELDGTRGQRTFASIEHSCKPGRWVKDVYGSFLFVRHQAPAN